MSSAVSPAPKGLSRFLSPRRIGKALGRVVSGKVNPFKLVGLVGRVGSGQTVVTCQLPGFRLQIDLAEAFISQPIYLNGIYEPKLTDLMRQHLRPGMVLLDVGANLGYFTCLGASLVGEQGRVVAIEPEATNYDRLSRNIALNSYSQVEARKAGAGAEPGVLTLYKSEENAGDHRLFGLDRDTAETEEIEVVVLDALVEQLGIENVDMVKIDTQGFEGRIIQGFRQTIANRPPRIVIAEFWPFGIEQNGGSPDEFLATFADAGYQPTVMIDGGKLRPVPFDQLKPMAGEVDLDHPDASSVDVVFVQPGVLDA